MNANLTRLASLCGATLAVVSANAANVYVMSSGNPAHDDTVHASPAAAGHTSMIGLEYWEFDRTVPISTYDDVFLQANYNWTSGVMPLAGQQQLVAYVSAGGGLFTSEWVRWLALYYTKRRFPVNSYWELQRRHTAHVREGRRRSHHQLGSAQSV